LRTPTTFQTAIIQVVGTRSYSEQSTPKFKRNTNNGEGFEIFLCSFAVKQKPFLHRNGFVFYRE
jgi:hypothetical protein